MQVSIVPSPELESPASAVAGSAVIRNLDACTVAVSRAIVDALWTLERGAAEIALIIDENQRLCGVMTEGDIRRALLAGATLESPLAPFVQRRYTWVPPNTPRNDVLDLMRSRSIAQIPVLDAERRLVGLHLMREMLGAVPRDNWAVVMAGGLGTRLRPLTEIVPKPMLKVAGRPILERIVLHLCGFGIRRIFLAVNHMSAVIEEHFGDGESYGCSIEYLRESQALGTGGPLSLLPEHPNHALVVMNGDLVTTADLGAMLDYHEREGNALTVAVRPYYHDVPFGCIETNGNHIIAHDEKPRIQRTVNAGIYVLAPQLLDRIPANETFQLPQLVTDCLYRGDTVAAFSIEGDWIDVGHIDHLRVAREGEH